MGKKKQQNIPDLSNVNAARVGHNYLMQTNGGNYALDDLNLLNNYVNYLSAPKDLPKYKVGVVLICINQPYWQYMKQVIEGIKQFFLPGHQVEIMVWSDMPNYPKMKNINYGAKIFPVDSIPWPYPTLLRYNMILDQEDYLREQKYDYLFYIDLDMRIVNIVGDEILGNGITAAQHPMYALDKKFFPPYEPNPESTSYIPRPGRIINEAGKPRFEPLYYAGGVQGGTLDAFIDAMKATKELIDADLDNNYIPIWNDESAWNKYLFEHPPAVVLSPSYVYPDSMIQEYYIPLWGRDYTPRIITLTKPFSLTKEGGTAAADMMKQLKPLQ